MDPKMEVQINKAIEVLKSGGVILYPTDTIWGVGCDATNPEAVKKVFAIKKREESKSLVTLVSDLDMLARYVKDIPDAALDLIEVNDTPMTIIYPQAIGLAENVIAEDGSVGIRIPMNEFCRQLCFRLRKPIVSTSANISGENPPKGFKDISQQIKDAVDYTVHPSMEEKNSTHKASQIIKIGLKGEIQIIRK
ncbi:MAG: threonylcarbamoyl-AMP synthase [Bacteroidales bacterium]|nr:threonylcarbamoyl-AMP synthase [Bacteroidales bacterium]